MPGNFRQTRPARLPVTGHHLFPAALALWFGALFGLSSLAIRTALFEQWVLSSHLAAILPFAAPPLGHLARLLLALVFAAIGAGIGLAVARIVVRLGEALQVPPGDDTFRVRARDAHPDAPARRPVSAQELTGVAPIPLPNIRTAGVDDIAEHDGAAAADTHSGWHEASDNSPESELPTTVVPPVTSLREPEAKVNIGEPDAPTAAPEPTAVPQPDVADPPPVAITAADRIARAHPSELSPVELMERLAIAMQRQMARLDQDIAPISATEGPVTSGVARPAVRGIAGLSADERIATIETLRDTLAALRGTG